MIVLRLDFLSGKFHANPWDRGTNEGEVDWPPAPWRLLRAITAGWYRGGQQDRDAFLSALGRFADPPLYLLPRATAGHTRHYMPLGTSKKGRPETSLVLDSFIAIDRTATSTAAYVIWPHAELPTDERQVIERCCARIGYLGRAESWCSLALTEVVPNDVGLERVDLTSRSERDGPSVRRLAADPSLRGDRLLRSLTETTGEMRRARRLTPIGATWVEYRLPTDFLMVREQYERMERTRPVFGPTLLRFGIERGEHTPKPALIDAVVLAELLRASAIKQLSDRSGEPATHRISGKAEDGSKRSGHDHPYFLPFDREGRGFIDGIDVWFPHGCTHAEYLAVTSVSHLRERVIYSDDFPLTFLGAIEPPTSAIWTTATPIVLERFPKVRGTNGSKYEVDTPAEQVAEMIRRATGRTTEIEIWSSRQGIARARAGPVRVDAFRRMRIRKPTPPLPVVGATVRFEEAVSGPLVVGRLAHFGLGRFEPEVVEPQSTVTSTAQSELSLQ